MHPVRYILHLKPDRTIACLSREVLLKMSSLVSPGPRARQDRIVQAGETPDSILNLVYGRTLLAISYLRTN
jgi:hypothetical protein